MSVKKNNKIIQGVMLGSAFVAPSAYLHAADSYVVPTEANQSIVLRIDNTTIDDETIQSLNSNYEAYSDTEGTIIQSPGSRIMEMSASDHFYINQPNNDYGANIRIQLSSDFSESTINVPITLSKSSDKLTLYSDMGQYISLEGSLNAPSGARVIKEGEGTFSIQDSDFHGSMEVKYGSLLLGNQASLGGELSIDNTASSVRVFGNLNANVDNNSQINFSAFESNIDVSGNISGPGSILIEGQGLINFTGSDNDFTGPITSNAFGALNINISSSIDPNVAVSLNQDSQLNFVGNQSSFSGEITGEGSVLISQQQSLTLSGLNTYTGGTIIDYGDHTINDNALQGDISIGNFPLSIGITSPAYSYGNVISGNGDVIILGPGHLSFTGPNSYTGLTMVNAGASLELNDIALGSLGGGNLYLPDGTSTLTLNIPISEDPYNPVSYEGSIGGQGSLIKNGLGSLVLSHPGSAYSTVNVLSGNLKLHDSWVTADSIDLSTNSSSLTLSYAGENLDGSSSMVSNVSITGVGGSTVEFYNTSGVPLILNGHNTYSGSILLSSGSMTFNEHSLAGPVSINSSAELIINPTQTFNYYDDITGTGALTKEGPNLLSLLGHNSGYSGLTTINAGALEVNENSFVLDGSYNNSANLLINLDNADQTFTGSISGAGHLIKLGLKTLTLDTPQSYTGLTTILEGSLNYGVSHALSTQTNVSLASSGTLSSQGYVGIINGLTGSGHLIIGGGEDSSGSFFIHKGVEDFNNFTGSVQIDVGNVLIAGGAGSFTFDETSLMNIDGEFHVSGGEVIHNGNVNLGGYYGIFSEGESFFSNTSTLTFVGNASDRSMSNVDLVTDSSLLNIVMSGARMQLAPGVTAATFGTTNSSGIMIQDSSLNINTGAQGSLLTLDLPLYSDDASGIIVNGQGTLDIKNLANYGGTTEIQGGTVRVHTGFAATNSINLSNFSTLQIDNTSDYTFTNPISGYGHLRKTSNGKATLNGAVTSVGNTTVEAGILNFSGSVHVDPKFSINVSDGATLSYSGTIIPTGILFNPQPVGEDTTGQIVMNSAMLTTYNSSAPLMILGTYAASNPTPLYVENFFSVVNNMPATLYYAMTGTGSFHKNGPAELVIDNLSSGYTGSIIIEQGLLTFNEKFGASSPFTIDSDASLAFNLETPLSLQNTISGSGTVIKTGPSNLTIDGVDGTNFSGSLLIDRGSLYLQDTSFNAIDSSIVVYPYASLNTILQTSLGSGRTMDLQTLYLNTHGTLRAIVDKESGDLRQLNITTLKAQNGGKIVVQFDPSAAESDLLGLSAPIAIKTLEFDRLSSAPADKLLVEFRPISTGDAPSATIGNVYPLITLMQGSLMKTDELSSMIQLVMPIMYDYETHLSNELDSNFYGQQYAYAKTIYVKLTNRSYTRAASYHPKNNNVVRMASYLDTINSNAGTALSQALDWVNQSMNSNQFTSSLLGLTPMNHAYTQESLLMQRSFVDTIGLRQFTHHHNQQAVTHQLKALGLNKQSLSNVKAGFASLNQSSALSSENKQASKLGLSAWSDTDKRSITSIDGQLNQELSIKLMGVKHEVSDSLSLGIQGAYAESDYHLTNKNGQGQTKSHYAQGFSHIQFNDDSCAGIQVETALHSINNQRVIRAYTDNNEPLVWTADSHRSSFESKAHMQWAKNYQMNAGTTLAPQLLADITVQYAPGYQEMGADDLNLKINSKLTTRALVGFGVESLSVKVRRDGWTAFTLGLNYEHDLKINNNNLTYSFADSSVLIQHVGPDSLASSWNAKTSLQFGCFNGLMVNAMYQLKMKQGSQHYQARAQLSYEF